MLPENLQAVKANIVKALQEAPRKDQDVTLVAVGKTYDADVMRQALMAGQRVFGENRVRQILHSGKLLPIIRHKGNYQLIFQ